MLENIITYLNTYLAGTVYFQKTFGLIEIIRDSKDQESPKEYCKGGELKEVSNFDSYNGVAYWRKNGTQTQEEFDSYISCDKFLRINIPLKLICAVPRKKTATDDAYSDDRIASDITKVLHHSSSYLKGTLKARRVNITVPGVETNNQIIFQEEYSNVSRKDINFKWAYLALFVNVLIEIRKDCIDDSCTTLNACEVLLAGLTRTQKLECLLPDYDFSDNDVFTALTDEQIETLTDLLCTSAPVTIYKSNGTTVVTTVAPGGSYTIAKHTIFKSDGVTVVTTQEFDENYTTPLVVITDNLSFPATINKEAGETYTCTPISSATCQQLNDNLTVTQRSVIQQTYPMKTAQTTSYRTGDDGDLEFGRLVNFTTLGCNTPFGNTNRFTDSLGAQLYGSGNAALSAYVIDHATGLGWYNSLIAVDVWTAAIDNANAFATHFADWRLPNKNEINTLLDAEQSRVLNYAPFLLGGGPAAVLDLWTSTTVKASTGFAYIARINSNTAQAIGILTSLSKGSTANYIYVRTHYT